MLILHSFISNTEMNHLLVELISKVVNNTYKSRYFINYKTQKIKIKYECSAENKIFFYYNAG